MRLSWHGTRVGKTRPALHTLKRTCLPDLYRFAFQTLLCENHAAPSRQTLTNLPCQTLPVSADHHLHLACMQLAHLCCPSVPIRVATMEVEQQQQPAKRPGAKATSVKKTAGKVKVKVSREAVAEASTSMRASAKAKPKETAKAKAKSKVPRKAPSPKQSEATALRNLSPAEAAAQLARMREEAIRRAEQALAVGGTEAADSAEAAQACAVAAEVAATQVDSDTGLTHGDTATLPMPPALHVQPAAATPLPAPATPPPTCRAPASPAGLAAQVPAPGPAAAASAASYLSMTEDEPDDGFLPCDDAWLGPLRRDDEGCRKGSLEDDGFGPPCPLPEVPVGDGKKMKDSKKDKKKRRRTTMDDAAVIDVRDDQDAPNVTGGAVDTDHAATAAQDSNNRGKRSERANACGNMTKSKKRKILRKKKAAPSPPCSGPAAPSSPATPAGLSRRGSTRTIAESPHDRAAPEKRAALSAAAAQPVKARPVFATRPAGQCLFHVLHLELLKLA